MLDLNSLPQDPESACLQERAEASISDSTSSTNKEGPLFGNDSTHGDRWSTDRGLGSTHGGLKATDRGLERAPAFGEPSTSGLARTQPGFLGSSPPGKMPGGLASGKLPGGHSPPGNSGLSTGEAGVASGNSGLCPGSLPGSMGQKRKVPGIPLEPSRAVESPGGLNLRHLKELALQQAWEEEPAQKLLIPSGVKGTLSSSWIHLGQELWAKGMTLGLERFAQHEEDSQQPQEQSRGQEKKEQEEGQGKEEEQEQEQEQEQELKLKQEQEQEHRKLEEEEVEGSHADVQRSDIRAPGSNKQCVNGVSPVAFKKRSSRRQDPGLGCDGLLDLNDVPVDSLLEHAYDDAHPSCLIPPPCFVERDEAPARLTSNEGPRRLGFNLNLSAEYAGGGPAQVLQSPESSTLHRVQQEEQLRESSSAQQGWLRKSPSQGTPDALYGEGPQAGLLSPEADIGERRWPGSEISGFAPMSAVDTCDALKHLIGARIQPGIQPGMQPCSPSGATPVTRCTKSLPILSAGNPGLPAGADRPTSRLSLVHRLAATIESLQTKHCTPGDQGRKDKATPGQLAQGKRRRVDVAVLPLTGLANASLASSSLALATQNPGTGRRFEVEHAKLPSTSPGERGGLVPAFSGAGPVKLQVLLPASLGQPGRQHGPHGMAQGQAVPGLHDPRGLHVVCSGPSPLPRLAIGQWGRSKGRGVEEGMRRKLIAAAEALDRRDMTVFKELSQQLRGFAKKRGSAFERVVFLLLQALNLRAEGKGPDFISKPSPYTIQDLENGRMWYYTATPYCLFATIALSGMILPKLIGRKKVHVVNAGEVSLPQWPAILRLLAGGSEASRSPGPGSEASRSPGPGSEASRSPGPGSEASRSPGPGSEASRSPGPGSQASRSPGPGSEASRSPGGRSPAWMPDLGGSAGASGQGGPVSPSSTLKRFRYTNINCSRLSRPRRFDFDMLKGQGRVASVLSSAAEGLGVEFHFQGLDLEEDTLGLLDCIEHRPDETLVVVMGYDLKFFSDHEGLGGGARQRLMHCVRRLAPDLVAVVEDDAPLNQPHFVPRFSSCLDVYSAFFETHDLVVQHDGKRFMHTFEQQYHGITLVSVVACEGRDRRIRPTTRGEQDEMFREQGFVPCTVGSLVGESEHELLKCYPEGFGIVQEPGAVVLTWKGFPMASAGAWTLRGSPSPSR